MVAAGSETLGLWSQECYNVGLADLGGACWDPGREPVTGMEREISLAPSSEWTLGRHNTEPLE